MRTSGVLCGVLCTVLLSYAGSPCHTDDNTAPTIVQTQSGLVQGIIEGDLRAFRSIPYAAPPLGDLRWRPPEPPLTWTGIRDASRFGNVCIQINFNDQLVGDEDCLTLNVFTAASPPSAEQPVMVFFHGGGNRRGSPQQPPFDSPTLAAHGAIVVTAQYRVGALGFFAHPLLTAEGDGSSSNYGLMDQIAALTWVQENIEAFGGDPERVMVFGQSAGAVDVQALLVSPAAEGLFTRAGIESDAIPLGALPDLTASEVRGETFVHLVGCDTASDVLGCLRALPANAIVNNQMVIRFAPTIEPLIVPEDPFSALEQRGSPVPLLIGSTREESTGFGDNPDLPLDASGYASAVHAEFDQFGDGVADQVLALYPASGYDTPRYALIAVHSDSGVTCAVRDVASVAAGAQRPAVWRYLFTHRFENDAMLNRRRAFHTAELFFVFGNLQNINGTRYVPSAAELALSDQLMDYWSHFAASGNPNNMGDQWPAYEAQNERMLELDENITVLDGYHVPQCNFFSTLPQP